LTITVPILDDLLLESNETFRVSLGNVTGGALLQANSNAVVRILEDDSALALTTNEVSVLENISKVTLTIARTGGTNFPATVDFLTVDGTATAGSDYTSTNETLTFTAGVTKKTVTLLILNDSAVEGDESFAFVLTNIAGADFGNYTNATITIRDNDSVISLSTNAVSVSESAGLTSLNVYRTGGVAAAATVRYSLVNGTATAGSDFKAKTATLSFAAGQTNKAISFQIINDLIVDPDETLTITLTSPTGEAAIGTNTTTVTILDNDFSTGGQILEQPDQEIFISAFEWNQGRPAVVEVEGPLGAAVRLQATTDFSTWEDVAEGVLSNSPLEWTDPASPEKAIRFYRVIQAEKEEEDSQAP
jgi:hypothetical protein